MKVTLSEIEAARTPSGGWTRSQLAEWGVPWPPPKGWKARLAGTTVVEDLFYLSECDDPRVRYQALKTLWDLAEPELQRRGL